VPEVTLPAPWEPNHPHARGQKPAVLGLIGPNTDDQLIDSYGEEHTLAWSPSDQAARKYNKPTGMNDRGKLL
jgi:hypothetical protein